VCVSGASAHVDSYEGGVGCAAAVGAGRSGSVLRHVEDQVGRALEDLAADGARELFISGSVGGGVRRRRQHVSLKRYELGGGGGGGGGEERVGTTLMPRVLRLELHQ
jgi:hypothetical protein